MTCNTLAAVLVVNAVVSIALDFFNFFFHFYATPFNRLVSKGHIVIIKINFLNILYKSEKR